MSELLPNDIVGDVAIICNTPQPYTVRVCELCSLLRIDKQSLTSILIAKQEAELVLGVNNAAYHGDLFRLKGLISAGADPSKPDHDGRTALVRELDLADYFFTGAHSLTTRFHPKFSVNHRSLPSSFFVLQHVAALRGYEDIVRFLRTQRR